jgi:hypothetical protein
MGDINFPRTPLHPIQQCHCLAQRLVGIRGRGSVKLNACFGITTHLRCEPMTLGGGIGAPCRQNYFPIHHSRRAPIASHDGIHSSSPDDNAVGEPRPVTAALNVSVSWSYMQHAGRVRAEGRVVFGKAFFGHRHSRHRPPRLTTEESVLIADECDHN